MVLQAELIPKVITISFLVLSQFLETVWVPFKSLKLPAFRSVDKMDKLDSYLLHFERYTKNVKWEKNKWAIKLITLHTGRAMDIYTRM